MYSLCTTVSIGISTGNRRQGVTTPSAYTKSIDFTSSLTGWAVANGSLYETTDGGTTWRVHATSGGVDSVFFTTAETGFAVGSNQVLRTVDGGRSWHLVFSAPVNQQVVWQATVRAAGQSVWLLLVGDDAGMMKAAYVVFHSVDGGVNWTGVLANPAFASDYPTVKVPQDIDSYPGPFTALNERTAYFFGSCPACYAWGTTSVVSTLDSARTWSRALVSGEAYVQGSDSISFPDARHGWAAWTTASGQGEILSTPDGGREWMVQAPGDVGLIPTNVSPATVVMVPPGRSLHLPGVQAGTVVWQDGTIDSNGQSRPFYVWAGSGLVDAQSYSFLLASWCRKLQQTAAIWHVCLPAEHWRAENHEHYGARQDRAFCFVVWNFGLLPLVQSRLGIRSLAAPVVSDCAARRASDRGEGGSQPSFPPSLPLLEFLFRYSCQCTPLERPANMSK